jgi:hypothetical protein
MSEVSCAKVKCGLDGPQVGPRDGRKWQLLGHRWARRILPATGAGEVRTSVWTRMTVAIAKYRNLRSVLRSAVQKARPHTEKFAHLETISTQFSLSFLPMRKGRSSCAGLQNPVSAAMLF